jgi:membrane-associated phospholipid phosphatase
MSNKNLWPATWLLPLLPIVLACVIYFSDLQTSSFLLISKLTQALPDIIWAFLTYLGNGWGIFAIAFPLLLLAPRLLTAGIFAGAISAIVISVLKPFFNFPRPASILAEGSFHRIGELLLSKAFPSGHTLTAFAIAGALYFASAKSKRGPLLWLFILASLVGLSRIAVGAHWLTDVLAGAGVGLWCGMIGAMLSQYINDAQLLPNKIWPRMIAVGGLVTMYMLLTQTMDLELNHPVQYVSVALIAVTLLLFTKAQMPKVA